MACILTDGSYNTNDTFSAKVIGVTKLTFYLKGVKEVSYNPGNMQVDLQEISGKYTLEIDCSCGSLLSAINTFTSNPHVVMSVFDGSGVAYQFNINFFNIFENMEIISNKVCIRNLSLLCITSPLTELNVSQLKTVISKVYLQAKQRENFTLASDIRHYLLELGIAINPDGEIETVKY